MDLSKKKARPEKKSKAMTLRELSRKIEEIRSLFIDPSPLIAEYHRRLAWSLSPLIFILLGFPFAAITHRRAKSANLLYALLFAAPYYILSLACQGMASQNVFNPIAFNVGARCHRLYFGHYFKLETMHPIIGPLCVS